MKKITLISHFYGNTDSVNYQIQNWNNFKNEIKDITSFLLIDDCSPEKIEEKDADTDLSLSIYRIKDDIKWNQAGARNLAALLTKTEWAIFFDIDQIINHEPFYNLLNNLQHLNRNVMYHLKSTGVIDTNNNNNTLDFAPSTYLVNTHKFREIGMLDEDFSGNYGYEDIYLHETWKTNNGERLLINNESYFKDNNKHTSKLNRDLNINKELFEKKLKLGTPRPNNFIRFSWEEIKGAA